MWTPPTADPATDSDGSRWNNHSDDAPGVRLPLGLTLASPTKRILATMVDGLSYQAVWAALWLLGVADSFAVGSTTGLGLVVWLLGLMAWRAVWVWRIGATPGKLLFSLKVADARTGAKPSLKAASLRTIDGSLWLIGGLGAGYAALGSTAAGLMMLASLVLLFKDARRQTVNDHIADTIVIQG